MKYKMLPLLIVLLSYVYADESSDAIHYHLAIQEPSGIELQEVIDSIPKSDYKAASIVDWQEDTTKQLRALLALVESGNFKHGTAQFNRDNPPHIDLDNLSTLAFHFSGKCLPCDELTFLQKQSKEKLSYKAWAAQTIEILHAIQMLILKGNIAQINSSQFLDRSEPLADETLVDVLFSYELGAIKPSERFKALEKAIPSATRVYRNREEWNMDIMNFILKFEELILERSITIADGDIKIG